MQNYLATNNWIWVDYAIAATVLVYTFSGLLAGFGKEVSRLAVWLMALWMCANYSAELSLHFQDKIPSQPAKIGIACVLLYFASLLIGAVIHFFLGRVFPKSAITVSDRLLGMGVGAIRAVLLVSVLELFASFTRLPEDQWWKQSQLLSRFQGLALWLKDFIPS